jgi:YebC/PmpR family DNA-binding regulatory protein
MSGHSRWSTIKRTKAVVDAKRSKVWTKLLKEVTIAARLGGGDPSGNPRLRRALDLARAQNVPNDTIARAIKKGTGELEGMNYEEITYEGVGPSGALFVIEAMTDNRNRTAPEIRRIFEKKGGALGVTGSSTWAFTQKGVLRLPAGSATEEQLFEVAVGAGAEDVVLEGDTWVVTTAREALETVREALEGAKLLGAAGGLAFVPNTPKVVSGDDAATLVALFETLDDHDDVQNVFADFELDEAALAELG